MLKYIWSKEKSGLTELSEDDYRKALIDIDPDMAKQAFNKAWETRNFEIEMYWKRATYFWAFIASTFVGYFALIGTASYKVQDQYAHVEVYFLICIGFILSYAWLLTNIGSKSWQRHWETHVDLLENQFTGPLYKIVNPRETFSVSKINEIVSAMFTVVWILLGVKYLLEQNLIQSIESILTINWFVWISSACAGLAVIAMTFGHGRGRFGERAIKMYMRKVYYNKDKKK